MNDTTIGWIEATKRQQGSELVCLYKKRQLLNAIALKDTVLDDTKQQVTQEEDLLMDSNTSRPFHWFRRTLEVA